MCNPATFLLNSFLFLWLLALARCLLDANSIRANMAALNVVCRDLDSCRDNRTSDSLKSYNCHCGSYCRDLGTCCIDSRFRPLWHHEPRYLARCQAVYGNDELHIYMVGECRRGWRDDDDGGFLREMCASNGEDRNDPFLAVPVTSLRTGFTYKNYYCGICNENPPEGQVAFWNIAIRSPSKSISNPTDRDIVFDSNLNSWTIQSDDGSWGPIVLDLQIPDRVRPAIHPCRKFDHISRCSPDWTDSSTAEKCSAYTALVHAIGDQGMVRYRNPHCAICNFVEPYSLHCEESLITAVGFSTTRKTFFVGLFILEEESRKKKCDQGKVFDGLAKKCRTVRCRRNQTLRDRKCVLKNS